MTDTSLRLTLAVLLLLLSGTVVWALGAIEAERERLQEVCDLHVMLPTDAGDLEAYPNRQTFPQWCGPDPLAVPAPPRPEA